MNSTTLSSENFHSLYDPVPTPVALLDEQLHFVSVNEAFVARIGLPLNVLLGEYLTHAIYPLSGDGYQSLEQLCANGGEAPSTLRIVVGVCASPGLRADLQLTPLQAQGVRLYLMTLDFARDVASELIPLRNHDDLLRTLFERSPVAISVQDANYRLVFVNSAYCALVGYSADELLGRDPKELLHPPEHSPYLLGQRVILSKVKPRALPIMSESRQVVHRDGHRIKFSLELVPVPLPDSSTLWFSTLHNAVQLSNGETTPQTAPALTSSSPSLHSLVHSLPDAIVIINVQYSSIVYANESAPGLFGCELNATEDRSVDFLIQHFPAADHEAFKRALHSPAASAIELCVDAAHDRQTKAKLRIRMFFDASAPGFAYVIGEDVTQKYADEQARLADEAQQRLTITREAHHRIKNSLQAVAGLLERTGRNSANLSLQLGQTILQIRSIATVHALQFESGMTTNLKSICQRIADDVTKIFGVPITLVPPLPPEPVRIGIIEAAAVPIGLALSELLTNAAKHCDKNYPVELEIQTGESRVNLIVKNRGTLPALFDLQAGTKSLGGLGLIKALTPRRGCELTVRQNQSFVWAELLLTPPVIISTD